MNSAKRIICAVTSRCHRSVSSAVIVATACWDSSQACGHFSRTSASVSAVVGSKPSNRFSGLLIFAMVVSSLPSSSSAMVRPTVRASVSSRFRSASSRRWCSRSTATWSI